MSSIFPIRKQTKKTSNISPQEKKEKPKAAVIPRREKAKTGMPRLGTMRRRPEGTIVSPRPDEPESLADQNLETPHPFEQPDTFSANLSAVNFFREAAENNLARVPPDIQEPFTDSETAVTPLSATKAALSDRGNESLASLISPRSFAAPSRERQSKVNVLTTRRGPLIRTLSLTPQKILEVPEAAPAPDQVTYGVGTNDEPIESDKDTEQDSPLESPKCAEQDDQRENELIGPEVYDANPEETLPGGIKADVSTASSSSEEDFTIELITLHSVKILPNISIKSEPRSGRHLISEKITAATMADEIRSLIANSNDPGTGNARERIINIFYCAAGGISILGKALHPETQFAKALTTLPSDRRLSYLKALNDRLGIYLSAGQRTAITKALSKIEKSKDKNSAIESLKFSLLRELGIELPE